MQPKYHVAISAVISGVLYILFKSWALAFSSFVSGIFIDLDHVIDYMVEHGLHIDMKKFFHFFYGEQYRKLTLILHGWEWLIVLLILSWLTSWNPWVTGVFIGFSQHLISDRVYNISNFWSYSLIFRWKNKFDTKVILLKNRDKGK
ncbi:hypothetical protein EP227_06565 [bacterium]|nr:MAG: hypothetical protein EP227_06565 [bacterium]